MWQQHLENVPGEVLEQKAFLPVKSNKHPVGDGWQEPEKHKTAAEVEGRKGFFVLNTPYFILDFDKLRASRSGPIDPRAEERYNMVLEALREALGGLETYTEWSLSGRGLHMILKPEPEALQGVKLKGGENGSIPLLSPEDQAEAKRAGEKLPNVELFYHSAQQIILTGDRVNAAGIVSGEAATRACKALLRLMRSGGGSGPEKATGEAPEPLTGAERERLLSALESIDPNCSYDDWISAGMACWNAGLTCEDWERWCSRGNKYDPRRDNGAFSCETKWRTFGPQYTWNAGTIIKRAHAAGWKDGGGEAAAARRDFSEEERAGARESVLSALRRVADIAPQEQKWFIKPYLPEGEPVLMSGDGGVGKTAVWCTIAAAITTGGLCFLDEAALEMNDLEPLPRREPGNVLYFSSEDDTAKVLRRRLEAAGADLSRIETIDLNSPVFCKLKFNSPEVAELLRARRPKLAIFDPVQSFVPERVDESSRNQMRAALNPLIGLCHELGTTSLIISHTNKRERVSGRGRISDSSDLWDMHRSVLILGKDETQKPPLWYLSQEKCNYGPLGLTCLYDFDENGAIELRGTTIRHDRDFVDGNLRAGGRRGSVALTDCKDTILEILEREGPQQVRELEQTLTEGHGFGKTVIRRAREELRKAGEVKQWSAGGGKGKKHFVALPDAAASAQGEK